MSKWYQNNKILIQWDHSYKQAKAEDSIIQIIKVKIWDIELMSIKMKKKNTI